MGVVRGICGGITHFPVDISVTDVPESMSDPVV